MESFALFHNANVLGKKAGCILTISDSLVTHKLLSAEERETRRLLQNQELGIDIPYEEILQNIIFRDNNDKTSDVAPLKQANDAILVDSTNMTIDEVVQTIINIIKEVKQWKKY